MSAVVIYGYLLTLEYLRHWVPSVQCLVTPLPVRCWLGLEPILRAVPAGDIPRWIQELTMVEICAGPSAATQAGIMFEGTTTTHSVKASTLRAAVLDKALDPPGLRA